MSSENDLWISVLAAAAGSQAAGAGSAETSHGACAQRSRRNVDRGSCSWFSDYLSPSPVYHAAHSRRRFRVPPSLYLRIERDQIRNFPEDFATTRICSAGRLVGRDLNLTKGGGGDCIVGVEG
jgi:hypothetical protein